MFYLLLMIMTLCVPNLKETLGFRALCCLKGLRKHTNVCNNDRRSLVNISSSRTPLRLCLSARNTVAHFVSKFVWSPLIKLWRPLSWQQYFVWSYLNSATIIELVEFEVVSPISSNSDAQRMPSNEQRQTGCMSDSDYGIGSRSTSSTLV